MKHSNAPAWFALAATVILEVAATLFLKASDGFSVLIPSIISIACYALTVVALSIALKGIPVSIAYIIWTGAGTVGVALFGVIFFHEKLGLVTAIGLVLVVAGVVMINTKSAEKAPTESEINAEEAHAERS